MKLEQIIKLKLNNFEIKVPKPIEPVDLASYPWDQCVADQVERYGDEETAKKVCGAIKAMYGSKEEMEISPNPCWDGYEPIGLKDDGSPNCVPVKAAKEDFVIPSPESGEEQDKYISRCISAIIDEYGQEQASAICYSKWEGK
jgi:hypothetical protein